MKFSKILFAGATALVLSSCANSALTVERPYNGSFRTGSVNIVADNNNVAVDEENLTYTQQRMERAFFEGDTPLFTRGSGMTVRYRYVAFDEGSQALRYLTGPIAGGSKIVLEVDFVGANGEVMSTVRGEGTVAGGFAGGSNKSGIDLAIDKIAAYAAERFKN